jgi:hypothetical protein
MTELFDGTSLGGLLFRRKGQAKQETNGTLQNKKICKFLANTESSGSSRLDRVLGLIFSYFKDK